MSEVIRVRCGGCEVKIKAPLKYQGRSVNCPQCGFLVSIPVLKSAAALAGSTSRAAAPALLPSQEARPPAKPKAAAPLLVEEPLELGDDAFIDEPPKAKRKPAARDDIGNFDLSEFEDYGPAVTPGRADNYGDLEDDAPKPKKRKKPKKKAKSSSGGGIDFDASIIGGLIMMIGAVVWFVLGLMGGIIFFYPPVLFVFGIVAFVKGLID